MFCMLQGFAEAGFPPGVQHGLKRFVQFVTGYVGALLVGLQVELAEDRVVEDFPGPYPCCLVERQGIGQQVQYGGQQLVTAVDRTVSLGQPFLDAGSFLSDLPHLG
ncbi:MAG TPA: hypothetical protein VGS08_00790 [Candidatus Saccharimonadales bacterium]|nr:hypothetical protein [Candidatus Saccharimonadales bacterium]